MSDLGFGEHLFQKGIITREQLDMALALQNKFSLLGEIALEENYLTKDELAEIYRYMESRPDVKLGEAAISLGFLTATQFRYLLDIRTRRKSPLGRILVEKAFIGEETLNREITEYDATRRKFKKILVCETARTMTKLLTHMLSKYGFETLEAKNGREALETAKREKPHLLITGNVLGDMEGSVLCHTLIMDPETSGIRSIILSSSMNQSDMERAFDAGVNHFLRKPIREDELVNVIHEMEREELERKPERILVVDDSPGARRIILKELSAIWPDIHTAQNGKEAVEMAKALKPDIITMDLEMPVMDGLEACRILKDDPDTENIPVVLISASDTPELRARGFEAGAAEYFVKPFRPRKLAEFFRILVESKKIRRKEKILIVDDSKTTCHILKYYFIKNGYTVFTVTDGTQALEALRKNPPDLVIVDCYMPGLDGFALTRKIKESDEWRRIPVLLITAYSKRADVLKGFSVGAADYLIKPCDESELMARVDSHLRNKALLEQLERNQKKLRIANEEKDRFLGIAAHDLRNPLGAIIGYASLLAEGELSEEMAKRFAVMVREASGGMLRLLEDLLDITTIANGKVALNFGTHVLAEVVRERGDLLEIVAAKKKIPITYSLAEGAAFQFDRNKIEQVVDNLISNAIKFSPPGNGIHISITQDGSMARVEVRDEGPGIPEEELTHLFKPFHRLSVKPTSNEKSTGLGLSIAARIVEAHGGEMGVTSKPGHGSTFFFTLPRNTDPATAAV